LFTFVTDFDDKNDYRTMEDNKQERFPIVDESGEVVGSATRGECHDGSRMLHPVVHLHVFNSQNEVYLQKRPEWKDIQPGKWDTSVGGHMDYGETPDEALVREAGEELGITDFQPVRVGQYVFDSRRERELVYVNRTTYNGRVCPSAEELDGGRFWTLDEIRAAIGQDILTPNFESEFQRFFLTPKDETYRLLTEQIGALVEGETDAVCVMANVAAAIHSEMGFFWTGFYRVIDGELRLGPFQGPVACMHIGYGKGVCGTAWQRRETIVVPDVEAFPGHIACSSLSRSEIVVPVFNSQGDVAAVLDIDSRELGTFDDTDRRWLERICGFCRM
jgi:putative methionine-R-sulfoxide reductase with GAF domain